ncbi:alpha/beta hydrolase [Harryflintia acetispora]|uniref:alpha/beta hydrolase n=1 Tax=Harryflintia acetispora TaxID=1849041 RepID=UPI0033078BBC
MQLIQTEFTIGALPAALWGEGQEEVIVAVHGNFSSKTDTPIRLLAEHAAAKGCQVLSFDLPGHGARREEGIPCKVQTCVWELCGVLRYARERWKRVGLFGCSMGAYFGLLACQGLPLERCLFLSPVVDMQKIIEGMMAQFHVTPGRLRAEGEIPTPIGQTLYWDYYRYVSEHPVTRWDAPTAILCGSGDDMSGRGDIQAFAERFHCKLDVLEGGEHYFHTPGQLAYYEGWLKRNL